MWSDDLKYHGEWSYYMPTACHFIQTLELSQVLIFGGFPVDDDVMSALQTHLLGFMISPC